MDQYNMYLDNIYVNYVVDVLCCFLLLLNVIIIVLV